MRSSIVGLLHLPRTSIEYNHTAILDPRAVQVRQHSHSDQSHQPNRGFDWPLRKLEKTGLREVGIVVDPGLGG